MVDDEVPPPGPSGVGELGLPVLGAGELLIELEELAVATRFLTGAGVGFKPVNGISLNSTIFPLQFPGFVAKAVLSTNTPWVKSWTACARNEWLLAAIKKIETAAIKFFMAIKFMH